MSIIERILVTTDFSDNSKKACQFAEKIAVSSSAVVDLIHVIPKNATFNELIKKAVISTDKDSDNLDTLVLEESKQKLESLKRNQFSPDTQGDAYVVKARNIAKTITSKALDYNYSLIVISAKGKQESSWFRGSTTEEVIRSSKVPVLCVYEDYDELEDGQIVVPVDGSVLSMSATPLAAVMATIFNASITYLYVHEEPALLGTDVPDDSDEIKHRRTAENLMDRLMDYLDTEKPHGLHVIDSEGLGITALVFKNQEIGVSFETISGSSAHQEIISYANKFGDMVVITSHGRSGLAHMLLGSNAEKVALNTEKTVLIVRPDPKLFEKQKNVIPTS